jgi:uncharacterized RDD family membrane protein YckC
MFKSYHTDKAVGIVAFIIAILGLFSISPFIHYPLLLNFTVTINLWISRSFSGNNYLNIFLYCLLLAGSVFYFTSNFKESRLIRFVFSIILLSKIYYVIFGVIGICLIPNFLNGGMLLFITHYIAHFGYIYLICKLLIYINSRKTPSTEKTEYNNEIVLSYDHASLWQRFFHRFLDLMLCIIITYMLSDYLMYIEKTRLVLLLLQSILGPKFAGYLLLICIESIYLIAFESIFGATPAKFFTECRVLSAEGIKPSFKSILIRTLVRFVPFEGLSFITNNCWHDRWSNTMVVKEKSTGVSGASYLGIFPATIALFVLGYYISAAYNNYHITHLKDSAVKFQSEELNRKLDHLTTNDFFELKPTGNYEIKKLRYLKVEKVNVQNVEFSYLIINGTQNDYQSAIEKAYTDSSAHLKRVSFNKVDLANAYQEDDYHNNITGLKLNEVPYKITSINTFFMPNIKLSGSLSYGDREFKIGFINTGHTANIVDIKIIDGDVKITNPLPIHLNVDRLYQRDDQFALQGTATSKTDYKIDFTVKDSLGRLQTYETQGNTGNSENRTLKRLN